MREFKDVLGRVYDLDDPLTYAALPQDTPEVLNALYKEIGYARIYVLANNFAGCESGKEQIERIETFVNEVARAFESNPWRKPTIFWQEELFVFRDEIENMC